METCSEVWAFTGSGISKGMQQELSHARKIRVALIHGYAAYLFGYR
jgi:uncharacterized protein YutE (UPF0331/DUF86 family)